MKVILAILLVASVLSAVLISGCTQQTITPTPQGAGRAAEDKAAAALESELDLALENMTDADIEAALLSQ